MMIRDEIHSHNRWRMLKAGLPNGPLVASAAPLWCAAALAWGCSGSIETTATDQALAPNGVQAPNAAQTPGAATSNAAPAPSATANPSAAGSELAREVAEYSLDGDALRGGRLYDKFYSESLATGFEPDDPATPALDGAGGPAGNGTLRDGRGAMLDNAPDHGYRVKSFFGWDLRGADGVYGPDYQGKAYVAPYNLLEDALSREQVARLLVDGAAGVPAYGQVMSDDDLGDLVAFVMAVREHELPRPTDIWELDPDAPKGYVLKSGGDVAAGRAAIRSSCGNCHGADGTNLLFDDGEFSLGTLARSGAYEVWFKIVVGNPGSPMGSQVPRGESWSTQAQVVLDVLAALCDRSAFPTGAATEPDVALNDPRCGGYLR